MVITEHCVFLPIPHCGGQLVRDVLFETGPVQHLDAQGRFDQIPAAHTGKPVFTVIRHPLEWYVSLYNATWKTTQEGLLPKHALGHLGALVRMASEDFNQPFGQSMRNLWDLVEVVGRDRIEALLHDDRVRRDEHLAGAYRTFYDGGGGLLSAIVHHITQGLDNVTVVRLEDLNIRLPDVLFAFGHQRGPVIRCLEAKGRVNHRPRRFAELNQYYHPRGPFPPHTVMEAEQAIVSRLGYTQ